MSLFLFDRRSTCLVGVLAVSGLCVAAAPGLAAGTNSLVPPLVAGSNSFAAPADFDCDGHADISRKLHNGVWVVDLSGNGFGRQDLAYPAYGNDTAIPVPADYDGDCRADLSIKDVYGVWHIDYAADGFGAWNAIYHGYGPDSSVPVPADYDGDGRADLSVKDAYGVWYIDYAAGGFGAWNAIYHGYGPGASLAVPADYDGDGRADLSVLAPHGYWYIDYAADGFGAWNDIRSSSLGRNEYDWVRSEPVPADYDGDGRADLSIKSDDEFWYVDFSADGFGGNVQAINYWDFIDALGPPVRPTITLVKHTAHSLDIRIRAEGGNPAGRSAADALTTELQNVTGTSLFSYDDDHFRTFSSLESDTQYCVLATATNSEGSSSRTACFKTDYEAPPPPPPPPPQEAHVLVHIEHFQPGSFYRLLRILGGGFKAGEEVSLKITIRVERNNPFTEIRQTTADSNGRIDYKYTGSGTGVCTISGPPQPTTFQVLATGLTSSKASNVATAYCG